MGPPIFPVLVDFEGVILDIHLYSRLSNYLRFQNYFCIWITFLLAVESEVHVLMYVFLFKPSIVSDVTEVKPFRELLYKRLI